MQESTKKEKVEILEQAIRDLENEFTLSNLRGDPSSRRSNLDYVIERVRLIGLHAKAVKDLATEKGQYRRRK